MTPGDEEGRPRQGDQSSSNSSHLRVRPSTDCAWHVTPHVVQEVVARTGRRRLVLVYRCGYCQQPHLASLTQATRPTINRKAACGRGHMTLHLPSEALAS